MGSEMKLDGLNLEQSTANNNDIDGCSVGSMGAGGFDTRRSITSDLNSESEVFFNDQSVDPYDIDLTDLNVNAPSDNVLQQIKDTIQKQGSRVGGSSRSGSVTDSPQVKTSDDYQSVPYGIQPRATYEHGRRSMEIMGGNFYSFQSIF